MPTVSSALIDRLRYLVNDLDITNYTWNDIQLAKFITIAAIDVFAFFGPDWDQVLIGPYSVNTTSLSIDPDPLTNGAPDGVANLIVLKAACIISNSEFKKLNSTAGWKIVDDRSTIDGSKALDALKQVRDAFKELFDNSFNSFQAGNYNIGTAILSPYSSFNYRIGGNSEWPYYPPT